jgi:hypothetical protein
MKNAMATLMILCVACGSPGDDSSSEGASTGAYTPYGGGEQPGEYDNPEAQAIYDMEVAMCELWMECAADADYAGFSEELCLQAAHAAAKAAQWIPCAFDEEAADACIAALEAVDCSGEGFDDPEACEEVWVCED